MPDMIDILLQEAILRKSLESQQVIAKFFESNANQIAQLSSTMKERFLSGGRLFSIGNGGSACDAEHAAVEFMHPIFEKRRALQAISLTSSSALLTALANDIDFKKVFTKQLEQLATEVDMLLAISTSGMSPNLVDAVKFAREKRMLTVSFLGKDGGRMADLADYNFVVPSFSIHRIQEAHTLLLHVLWDCVHLSMGEDDLI
ncbi:MAG: SIS domain-containing protein [Candidatus Obscuribacterales bacterium]|nr:SIS domain-containing protein [Candidatus Obscuribacterales bacterium]